MCRDRCLISFFLGLSFLLLPYGTVMARDDREGLNFGLSGSWYGAKEDDRGDASQMVGKANESRQNAVFHFGYAFDEVVNLGLTFSLLSQSRIERIQGESAEEIIDRQTESDLRSYGLFFRFLFGRYFYAELGGGAYDYRNTTTTEFVSQISETQFSALVDEANVKGIGPGFHAAAGIEIPLKYGFFVTGNYRFFRYSTTLNGKNNAATRRSSQADEFVFGIHHYTD